MACVRSRTRRVPGAPIRDALRTEVFPSERRCALRSAHPVFLRVASPFPARYNTIHNGFRPGRAAARE
jgi:hypothetical protein